jgi:hypothetical protein
MKKKVIISIFAFIIISLSLVSILIIKNRRNTMTVNSNIIEDKPDSKVESSDEQNVDEKTILNDTKIEKKEDVSKNESINKSSTNNVEVSSKNSNNGSNNAIDNNQNNKQSNSTINSSVVENNKEETGPWTSMGLTKDQYENQPMYSWEHVDFATREECAKYGDNNPPYSTGEGSYECMEVTSWTRSLGWDYKASYN